MPHDIPSQTDHDPALGDFPVTRWTLIQRAGSDDGAQSRPALEEMCRLYWYPLYCYARRRRLSPEDAEDATQAFFLRLLDGGRIGELSGEKGRLRAYLLRAFSNMMNSQWRAEHREKRGGGQRTVSLDFSDAEDRYTHEPADFDTPERLYEMRWATTVLDLAFAALAADYTRAGKAELHATLSPHLTSELDRGAAEPLGQQLSMSPGAVRVALLRMRQRFRAHLEAQVAGIVQNAEDVPEEIAHLLRSVGGG
jgi:RNA polymerase sigma factor (sigma-70 family)